MKRCSVLLAVMGMALATGGAFANTPASSTMHFEGTLTDAGGGVYTGTIAATAGEYYVPGGPGESISTGGGFDVYAKEGGCALVQGYYGSGAWNCNGDDTYQVGYYSEAPHDAYPEPLGGGPWGSYYNPDVADWYHYELTLTADHWYLRYNGGTLGNGNATPMSGIMDWANMYASENNVGAYMTPPSDPDANDGDAADFGAGAGYWDMDWTWGSEAIPLELKGFAVTITDLGGGQYHVTLTPAAPPEVWVDDDFDENTPGWGVTHFDKIQDGVDAVSDGGTVHVATGTYQEQVVINKNLTLAGGSTPVLVAPAAPDAYQFPESSKWWEPVLFAYGGTDDGSGQITGSETISVTITGLTVDGDDRPPTSGRRSAGILLRNVEGTINNNLVSNMYVDGAETFCIMAYGDSNVVISDNDVSGYARGGIGANGDLGAGPDPHAIIENNVVAGPGLGVPVTWAPNGIQLGWGATGEIRGNTVTGNGWPGTEWSGSGIIVAASDDVLIESNTVAGNETGIAAVGDAWFGTDDFAIGTVIRGNEVYENTYGISLQERVQDTVIEYNNINNQEYNGIELFGWAGNPPSNTTINWNNLAGNNTAADPASGALFVGDDVALVDATYNWWGDAEGPIDTADSGETNEVDLDGCTASPEYEYQADGSGDAVIDDSSAFADYCPWLTAEATVSLVADEECYPDGVGDTIVISIDMADVAGPDLIVGGQFFLSYDTSKLDFESAEPGDAPFTKEIYETVDTVAGTIDYAVGIPDGGTGTLADTTMARLTFTAREEVCDVADLVTFRSHEPPSRLSDENGGAVNPTFNDLGPLRVDGTPPQISDLTVIGGDVDENCSFNVTFSANVTDNCCIDPDDIVVDVTLLTGNASLGTPEITKTQISGGYKVNGSVQVSDLMSCPATIQVTINAVDCCGHAATQAQESAEVNDTTSPQITCPADFSVQCAENVPVPYADLAAFIAAGGSASDNCDSELDFSLVSDSGLVGGGCGGTVTRVYRVTDDCGNHAECTQVITVNDTTPPEISGCPEDITVYADAGECSAEVTWTEPTASDNCTLASFTATHNPGDTFPQGTTTVTYTAVDQCGNTATCTFTVTVLDTSEMLVDVSLEWSFDGDRCITFELWDCDPLTGPTVVEQVLSFTAGSASAVVEVPCGEYTCITARDTLHTLRRTDESFQIVGTQYVADFTGDDALVGGNLNDDFWIDILDFGVYTWQWSVDYGTGDTACDTPYPHADISGDGVVTTADFTFIQTNFLDGSEANCCGQPYRVGGSDEQGDGPVTEIAVADLEAMGLGELAVADLNADGWLDQADVVAFLNGARPKVVPTPAPDAKAAPLRLP